MQDHSSSIEEILCNNDVLQQSIDTAVQTVCDNLGIDASNYIHHISIAQDGVDLSKEGQRKQIRQDISDYLAKGNQITVPNEDLAKEYDVLDKQLQALIDEHERLQ